MDYPIINCINMFGEIRQNEKGNNTYSMLMNSPIQIDKILIETFITSGFPQALEIMENLENPRKKVPCMENSWNWKKP